MKNRLHAHLTEDELIALAAFQYELLESTMQEMSACPECMKNIADTHLLNAHLHTLSSKEHALPSSAQFDAMVDKAFKAIPTNAQQETKKRASSFLPWLSTVAATLLIALGLYHYVNPNTVVEDEKQITQKIENKLHALTKKEVTFLSNNIVREGVTTFTMLENSILKKLAPQKFLLKDGKVHIKVESGNNTVIHINNEFIVRVLGTEFIITAHNHALDVSVSEGLVEVIHLGTGEVKTVAQDKQCHYDFVTVKKGILKHPIAIKSRPRIRQKLIAPPQDKKAKGSYLEQGREALQKGYSQKALHLFTTALHQKKGADKALFEIIRIHENNKQYKAVLKSLTQHRAIIKQHHTYQEEFYIKGCAAQAALKSGNFSFCNEYLKNFPKGYKRQEISALLGDKK